MKLKKIRPYNNSNKLQKFICNFINKDFKLYYSKDQADYDGLVKSYLNGSREFFRNDAEHLTAQKRYKKELDETLKDFFNTAGYNFQDFCSAMKFESIKKLNVELIKFGLCAEINNLITYNELDI